MRLSIRGKLFAVVVRARSSLSLLAGELYLRPAIEANLLDRIRADLFVRLALVDARRRGAHRPAIARRGTRWPTTSRRARTARVTFIDAGRRRHRRLRGRGGRPRPASRTTATGPRSRRRWPAAGSRRRATAPRSRSASCTRPSRCRCRAAARGVARLAVPLDEVAAALAAPSRGILWAALLIALVVALVASTTAAQVLSRALRRMTEAARRMAAGDLDGAPAADGHRRDRRAGTGARRAWPPASPPR